MTTAGDVPAALVDSHCHLVLLEERGLLQRALEGAAAAGVTQIVTVGVSLEDSEHNCAIAEAHDNVWFTVGWDPQQRHTPDSAEVKQLAALLRHPKAVAVGEVGLDLYFRPGYHETPVEVQQRSLRMMLELAVAHGKPVVIHDRDAHEQVLDAVHAVPEARGVMHCFTGDAIHMRRCVERGFVVSFAGIVTFARTEALQQAAREAPPDAYVLETDSPFLTPVPHRGAVNIPERVADTAARVAELRGEPLDAVRRRTTITARALFGLGSP
ncbi:MAG TPA: TatD family hydrolase [Candidatus Dormibacteraeota bacterium]